MIIKPALSSYFYFFYFAALLPAAYLLPLTYAEIYGIGGQVINSPLFWFFIGMNLLAIALPILDYLTREYDIEDEYIAIRSLFGVTKINKDEYFDIKEYHTLPDEIFGTKTYIINNKYWLSGIKNPEYVFQFIIRGG